MGSRKPLNVRGREMVGGYVTLAHLVRLAQEVPGEEGLSVNAAYLFIRAKGIPVRMIGKTVLVRPEVFFQARHTHGEGAGTDAGA